MPIDFKDEILHSASKKESEKIAVVDIGSNSVRLVVYDGLKRIPIPLFNEKVLCGLAKGMGKTGKLNHEGALLAEKSIGRFAVISKSMKVNSIHALATSAVRDATDGKDFIDLIEKKHGIKIKIVSGEDEAKFSTLGVLASISDPDGIVGDLGGGSLEISYADIKSNEKFVAEGFQSFPIGPLRLKSQVEGNRAKASEIIDSFIKEAAIIKKHQGKNFYAVGGGFRALGKLHIERKNYPLKVLHNYSVATNDFKETVEMIAKMPPSKIKAMHKIPENRIDTIAFTSLVAERIIANLKPKNFIFSVQGLREGYLFDKLSDQIKTYDPLISGACDFVNHIAPENNNNEWNRFGWELFEWMSPVFSGESKNIEKLRLAACILSRISWYEHTEYRAEMAFRLILDSSISGISHQERVFLAVCLYHRYKTNADGDVTAKILKLVTRQQAFTARIVGLAMRLGIILSGGALDLLSKTSLKKEGDYLVLSTDKTLESLIAENVEKRLEKLAESLGLDYKIRF